MACFAATGYAGPLNDRGYRLTPITEERHAPHLALVAGEASGDLLAGHLLDALRARWPGLQAAGIGGAEMAARGFEAWWPVEKLSVRGYLEVLPRLPELLRIRRQLAERLLAERPDLFIGVGRSEVNLHGSHWVSGFMMDKPLADLRDALADLGLERSDRGELLEDHLAAVAEVMRMLIVGAHGRAPAPLDVQRRFFETRIAPWAFRCCAAISVSPLANYYRCASEFVQAFLAIERDALAMD
ncbi:MAG: molecular chaperone TorD family protein [Burkholderiales bacterium]|nr:molecular chaperone TorD family protein [Burkholderiales bacterium]